MTLLFYPNFFRGKLPPNKIGLFLIRRHSLSSIKIGEEIGEGGIVRKEWNWGQRSLVGTLQLKILSFSASSGVPSPGNRKEKLPLFHPPSFHEFLI